MSRPGTAKRSLSAVSNPDLLKSPSNVSDGGTKLSIMMEDDEFLRKWSGPMLLGPLLPAIFSLMTIVSGHIILNTWTGYCGYSLDSFVGAALAVCYLFLIVYAWGFLGEKVYLNVPLTGTGFYILKPFSSLKWLMIFYFLVGFMSFIIWCVGAQLIQLSIFCANTSPLLYNFSLYLVVTYWVGFFIVGCYLIKLKFGNLIESYVSSQTKGPSVEDMEERIFRKEFKKLDKKKLGTLSQDLLSEFLVKVAVFVPEEELPNVLNEIGVEGDEDIEFNKLLKWFKEYNVKMNGYAGDEGDDGDEDEDEAKKGATNEKKGGFFSRNLTGSKKPDLNKKPSLKESESMGGGGGGNVGGESDKLPEGDEEED